MPLDDYAESLADQHADNVPEGVTPFRVIGIIVSYHYVWRNKLEHDSTRHDYQF